MFHASMYTGNLQEDYQLLGRQLQALLEDEPDRIANLSNTAALLNQFLDRINWVGFYLYEESTEQLVLGPFQGLPACVRIPINKGVCGTSAAKRETIRVANVHDFPGHIACDAASLSEIVIPLISNGKLIGVLDIDSPEENRFSSEEQVELERLVDKLMPYIA
ncbi:GAF domain-containing protein [Paenibacillus gansuensis]|uniref:GAF domain-containing protein n=1 Tax=Paenibacillus gansuensis TaxID=306542 RepID=A0ABW5P9V4_9BACL